MGTKIPWSRKTECSTPAQGTLRAFRPVNQRRRAQLREKSGVAEAVITGVQLEVLELAGATGRVKVKTRGARSESWFWARLVAGAAGLGCESDDLAAQQGMVTPCAQQARAWRTQDAGICAGRNGNPTSSKLQIVTRTVFTNLILPNQDSLANLFLPSLHQLLIQHYFCFASASWRIFMYLSGSPRNFGLHVGQQNLISWFATLFE